jgi:hypothetical protein
VNNLTYIFYISILIISIDAFGMFGFGPDLIRKELPKHLHSQSKIIQTTTSKEKKLTEKNQHIGRGRSISDTPSLYKKS